MTKYIVQSGGMKRVPELGSKNFEEVFKDLKNEQPTMLWCFFAEEDMENTSKYLESYNFLLDMMPDDRGVNNIVATLSDFESQVKEADVVYLHGGYPRLFLERVKKFNLPSLFTNKVVCTNSATTLALSNAGWDSDARCCITGLNILPCRTLVHFKAAGYGDDDPRGPIDWEAAYQELAAYGDPNLPIHALEEGEFVVLEI